MSVIVTLKGQKRYLSCCYLRFCAYSATITDMNFRIRIFNFCTSNCTPLQILSVAYSYLRFMLYLE